MNTPRHERPVHALNITQSQLDTACEIVHALAHTLRLEILAYIDTHPIDKIGDIYHALKIEQSICSAQLHLLADAGIITIEDSPSTKRIQITSINYEKLHTVQNALKRMYGGSDK